MQQLIKSTTAYKIFSSDGAAGRYSHAYLVHFPDESNLRAALKIFAETFFGGDPSVLRRVKNESFRDMTVYPPAGKKITVDGVSEIIADSALKPVEGDRKLYIIDDFAEASALVQNKLLKTLEEPPEGIFFLLGATSLSPVLDTVLSRCKLLEIPPFSEEEIYGALERAGENPLNRAAAQSAGGILGEAQNMVSGGWFAEVCAAADEICRVVSLRDVAAVAAKYADVKNKRRLLSRMQTVYFSALTGGGELKELLGAHTLVFALEKLVRAFADVKFNAHFQGLLYDFMSSVVKEREQWQKLQA